MTAVGKNGQWEWEGRGGEDYWPTTEQSQGEMDRKKDKMGNQKGEGGGKRGGKRWGNPTRMNGHEGGQRMGRSGSKENLEGKKLMRRADRTLSKVLREK
jgi:hypothetical protein